MKTFKYLLLFTLLTFIFSCKKEDKNNTNTIPATIKKETVKKEQKKLNKPWDSLNHKNTTAFLTKSSQLNPENKAVIKTKFGEIKLKLYDDTPLHRANFIFLTKVGYFNSTVFYRIVKNMAIQGGDSDNKTTARIRNKYRNYVIKPEIKPTKKHTYGALAAARNIEDNVGKFSSPFDFYIVTNKYGAHHLDGDYTIFGEVISGYSTIEKITKVETTPDEWPVEDIAMTIEILE
ncbi:peptidylprolyl isomerase [Tenacibaculum sp. IB213877]|uniref:peptidylprolyl isomerase n=1 Tax=Tenacibaculum sp. IB213877 TaxID=3097351 RepID=UPI002A5AB6BB|nr:peptidylprolyl isomerase [Tenacibaculum sp. IB213877]MDY0781652.1 peptidylprolyl isomerase [Tenacibaculum sp. IB213877]